MTDKPDLLTELLRHAERHAPQPVAIEGQDQLLYESIANAARAQFINGFLLAVLEQLVQQSPRSRKIIRSMLKESDSE